MQRAELRSKSMVGAQKTMQATIEEPETGFQLDAGAVHDENCCLIFNFPSFTSTEPQT